MIPLKKYYRSEDELGDEYCQRMGCKSCHGTDDNGEPNGYGCEQADEFYCNNEHLIMDGDAISFLLEEENKKLAEQVVETIAFCIDLQLYVKSVFFDNDNVKSFQQIRKAAYLHAKSNGKWSAWHKEFEQKELNNDN